MQTNQDALSMALGACLRQLRRTAQHSEAYQALSNGEFFALYTLSELEKDADHVRVSGLAKKMDLSLQAISKMLRALEGKGYIKRVTDPDDRRNTFIVITAEGTALLESARESYARFSREVIARMGEQDMKTFIQLSQRCVQIMDEVTAEFYEKKEEVS